MWKLKEHEQSARFSDFTAFMYLGEVIEYGPTNQISRNPEKELRAPYFRKIWLVTSRSQIFQYSEKLKSAGKQKLLILLLS